MKRVLLITDVNFWERCSGHRTRILTLIEYLAKHVQLTIVKVGPVSEGVEMMLSHTLKVDFFVLEKTEYLDSDGYGRRLKTFLKDKEFDTIIIEYIHCSYFLNFLVRDVKVILDAHDIISERTEEFKKFDNAGLLSGEYYEMSKESETGIFNIYDHVMVLCQPDYEKVTLMTGPDKALLCPHPVMPVNHQLKEQVTTVAFIASSYFPNRDAIRFFIENCWPRISKKNDVKLDIYGTICEELSVNDDEGISLKGFVPDQGRIYDEADIMINPVRFGAGLKIKNIEAMAHGIPLVTTTHGSRGIEAGRNSAFLVADTPEEFIETILLLIGNRDLRSRLGINAHQFIKDNFSEERCFGPLLQAIG